LAWPGGGCGSYWRSNDREVTTGQDRSAKARNLINSAMNQLAEASRLLEE